MCHRDQRISVKERMLFTNTIVRARSKQIVFYTSAGFGGNSSEVRHMNGMQNVRGIEIAPWYLQMILEKRRTRKMLKRLAKQR